MNLNESLGFGLLVGKKDFKGAIFKKRLFLTVISTLGFPNLFGE